MSHSYECDPAWWPHDPRPCLASCERCGSVAFAMQLGDHLSLWDPSFTDRRWAMGAVGYVTWTRLTTTGPWRQPWGLHYSRLHECCIGERPPRSPHIVGDRDRDRGECDGC